MIKRFVKTFFLILFWIGAFPFIVFLLPAIIVMALFYWSVNFDDSYFIYVVLLGIMAETAFVLFLSIYFPKIAGM